MSATKTYAEVRSTIGETAFAWFASQSQRWQLLADDQIIPACSDWQCRSPFGMVGSCVVVDTEGRPIYDRPECREIPTVHVVAWGMAADGRARFAVISQPRPHADDPEHPGKPNEPIVFGQIVMGFLDKILGADQVRAAHESPEVGAVRETSEESGARVVLKNERPARPWQNVNPTFVSTWSDIVFVQVDLDALEEVRSTRDEPIFKAEFITAEKLRQRVAQGSDASGAWYRMCTANSAWFIFFCCHPELFI